MVGVLGGVWRKGEGRGDTAAWGGGGGDMAGIQGGRDKGDARGVWGIAYS